MVPAGTYQLGTLALIERQEKLQIAENNWVRRICRVKREDRMKMKELIQEIGMKVTPLESSWKQNEIEMRPGYDCYEQPRMGGLCKRERSMKGYYMGSKGGNKVTWPPSGNRKEKKSLLKAFVQKTFPADITTHCHLMPDTLSQLTYILLTQLHLHNQIC